MKNFCLVFFFPYFFAFQISAQTPTIAWTKSFGNSTINWDIKPTADGNFIVLGRIYFDDTVVNCPLKGLGDILITKINTAGDILWQKCYGGSNDEGFGAGDAILPTADLGYIFITKTFSNDGDVSGNHGGDDIWVVKVDSMGAIQWQHCYGGTSSDAPLGIVEAGNQSFIILGLTNSLPGGDIPFRYGGNFDNDVWAARIDDSGNIIWTTVYGGSNSDFIGSISKLNNNQFQLAGYTNSGDGNLSYVLPFFGGVDGWLLRIDSNGTILFQKRYGGESNDFLISQTMNTDGTYLLFGQSESETGDYSNNHGYSDYWVIKINSDGSKVWQKVYGGSGSDDAKKILLAPFYSGYYLTGYSVSDDGDISAHNGPDVRNDWWIVKITGEGNLVWDISIGGDENDYCYSIATGFGSCLPVGYSGSIEGSFSNTGGTVVNITDFNSATFKTNNSSIKIFPNPTHDNLNILSNYFNKEIKNFEIYNSKGELIQQYKIKQAKQSMTLNVPSGIYFYRILDSKNNIVSTGDIIVQ